MATLRAGGRGQEGSVGDSAAISDNGAGRRPGTFLANSVGDRDIARCSPCRLLRLATEEHSRGVELVQHGAGCGRLFSLRLEALQQGKDLCEQLGFEVDLRASGG